MKPTIKIAIVALTILSATIQANACTVAIISGKYTKDGRPLLWKNRDTQNIRNKIMYFNDGKYEYMGLVNSQDKKGRSVWIGMNSRGFAIMNSASYNLNIGDTVKQSGREGRVIKEALATCATIEDFEKYLDNLPRPTKLEANFGVIDANGGAAMYELGNYGYVKFDANDPKVAPYGYIIRTNYSFTGSFGPESSGYIRYNTANELFYNAMATNSFDARFIIQDVTRSLKHSLTKTDLYRDFGDVPENTPTYTFLHDFIPRVSTASSCVVQGVKKDEDPQFSTMWCVVGYPLASVVVPVWLKGRNDFPDILKYNSQLKDSPVCHAALTLKKELFPINWGKYASSMYININALINRDKTGIRQKIAPFETEIFKSTNAKLNEWRKNGMKPADVKSYYSELNNKIIDLYRTAFGIDMR